MRSREFISESQITLQDLYQDNFPDRRDLFWDYVGTADLNTPLEIRRISPFRLSLLLRDQYRVEDLDELWDMMTDEQKEIVNKYMMDSNLGNTTIVLSGDRIIDGNHRALAAALRKLSVNSIDLSDLD